ncbi:MAG: drug/metabolite transporter (DMT)-like permease [Saprospiraceae bacterium]|jgi:drug/metabolite transporter (DMT)-like permease|uniref:EamA family transporter n=1 Tax=Patiriisocius sp. Uisw_047 TaxID=3230969 RepID=UPI0039E7C5E6
MVKKNLVFIILAFFSIYVFWGSTYLWNKIAVTQLAPFYISGIRMLTGAVIVFSIAKLMGSSLAVTKRQFINCSFAGFLFLAYGNGMFVWALKYIESGFGSLVSSLNPLFVVIILAVIHKRKMQPLTIVGIILGIIGMVLLISQKELSLKEGSLIGILMALSAVIAWSIGSVFVAKADFPKNHFVSTAYQMGIAAVLLLGSSVLIGEEWLAPQYWERQVSISLVCLVLFGSIGAFTSFNYLLKVVDTEKVTTASYINPIVALLLGWYFLDESVTGQSMLAAGVLLIGVYFINSRKRTTNVTSKNKS